MAIPRMHGHYRTGWTRPERYREMVRFLRPAGVLILEGTDQASGRRRRSQGTETERPLP